MFCYRLLLFFAFVMYIRQTWSRPFSTAEVDVSAGEDASGTKVSSGNQPLLKDGPNDDNGGETDIMEDASSGEKKASTNSAVDTNDGSGIDGKVSETISGKVRSQPVNPQLEEDEGSASGETEEAIRKNSDTSVHEEEATEGNEEDEADELVSGDNAASGNDSENESDDAAENADNTKEAMLARASEMTDDNEPEDAKENEPDVELFSESDDGDYTKGKVLARASEYSKDFDSEENEDGEDPEVTGRKKDNIDESDSSTEDEPEDNVSGEMTESENVKNIGDDYDDLQDQKRSTFDDDDQVNHISKRDIASESRFDDPAPPYITNPLDSFPEEAISYFSQSNLVPDGEDAFFTKIDRKINVHADP